VKTFSIGFDDDDHDESRYARIVSERFGSEHHELRVRPDVTALMPKIARHHGEPFGDSSALPTFALAELVSEHVTVVLTGDGGDESFAGYDRYLPSPRLERIESAPAWPARFAAPLLERLGPGAGSRSLRSRAQRLARLVAMDAAELYAASVLVFDLPARRALLEFDPAAGAERLLTGRWRSLAVDDRLDRMMGTDVETYLPGDLLAKIDTATMAHSVEARSPLLDHELMEFAATLPAELKRGKAILRSALRDVLPAEILSRPKMGFAVPLQAWLRGELAGTARELLLDPGAATADYLRRGEVERLMCEHASGVDHSMRIWALMMLETWHREVLAPAGA